MKRVILASACVLLAFVCIELSAAADKELTKEYHLVQSQIADEVPLRGPVENATVYVLICPDERLYVFRAFHSRPMEEVVKHFPRGSVLHYDGNALAAAPPEAQVRSLTAFCKSKGIELLFTDTN